MNALSILGLEVLGAFALGVGLACIHDLLRELDMRNQIPVTDAMVAREFRLQRCKGSPMEAITNPVLRRCLEAGARARAAREAQQPERRQYRDAKLRAANDND
ncbi:hypothetical protein [Paraburkholderia sp. 22B1P]|uniref:hypothetical protein n=1 Tax=Paraburkholderia sp. 22B1P TaxID=3080498 RepID=UPI0030920C33|nr:hypothetical protein PBP221_17430 [Paraburkholderia sp. 22B1P]